MEKIERVAAYVRVSTQEQKLHGLSLDAQRMKLTEYAEKNNMRIVEWYVDEGVSGRKLIRRRPELQRMIQDAEKGEFDRVIFIKLDRFFRSVAEYHECMKRIAPVLWTTTEEEYDLTTANGRMLVNMKLTIAELEADQTGERIDLVNEYKVQTGQPLVGDQSQPFGFKNAVDPQTGRKKVIRDPEVEPILRDVLDFIFKHQSKKGAVVYLKTKYNIALSYKSLSALLKNPMLHGAYRDNPTYCEAYLSPDEHDRLLGLLERNVKENTGENRSYIFSGLVRCPHCGRVLAGNYKISYGKDGVIYKYKQYRCGNNRQNAQCDFSKPVNENRLERLMLADVEKYLEAAKLEAARVEDSDAVKLPQHDIDDLHEQIDRLNYSWQTGKIRKVEQYEAQYAELMEKLELAEAERGRVVVKDFSRIEAILQTGWRGIYEKLDDAYKRAFWRSFIQSIELTWTTDKKEINKVNFF
jgi:DNA invertase Pin-like site-specific DNA recombinase